LFSHVGVEFVCSTRRVVAAARRDPRRDSPPAGCLCP